LFPPVFNPDTAQFIALLSNSPDGLGFFESMCSLHFFQRTTEYLTGNPMDDKHKDNLS
jgi:hypothetical protein